MLGGQGGGDEVPMPPGGEGLELAPGGLMSATDKGGAPTAPADPEVVGKLPVHAGEEVVSEAAKLPPPGEGLPKMSASGRGEPSAPGGGLTSGRGRKKLSLSGNSSVSASQTEGGGSAPPLGGGRTISGLQVLSKARIGKAKGSIPETSAGVTGPSSSQPADTDRLPPPPQKFAKKEKVLSYHGPLLYEAKVLKSRFRDPDREWTYLIHYTGWNKKWDVWVDEARLLKYSDENLKLQADLKDADDKEPAPKVDSPAKASSSGPGRKSLDNDGATGTGDGNTYKTPVPSGSSTPGGASGPGPEGRKKEEQPKLLIKIDIPEKLKLLLVEDWNEVIRKKRLAIIPAKVTIEQIFKEYLQGKNRDVVEVCAGLKDYFNALIGSQLLCSFERKQYEELLCRSRNENKKMTDYYGVAHLMRLFTKLGGCLTLSELEPEVISVIEAAIPNFFKFLLEKYEAYYSAEDYIVNLYYCSPYSTPLND